MKFVGFISQKWMNISSFMSSIYRWGSWAQGCWCAQTRHISQWGSRWAPGSRCWSWRLSQAGWGNIEGPWETLGLWEKGQPLLVRFHRIVPDFNLLAIGRTQAEFWKNSRWGSVWGGSERQIMRLVRLLRDCRAQISQSRAYQPHREPWEAWDSHDPRSTICHTSSHQWAPCQVQYWFDCYCCDSSRVRCGEQPGAHCGKPLTSYSSRARCWLGVPALEGSIFLWGAQGFLSALALQPYTSCFPLWTLSSHQQSGALN